MSDDCHFMGISFMECGMLHFFVMRKIMQYQLNIMVLLNSN